jgi:transcriptional regulator with XRE-family HTH domain
MDVTVKPTQRRGQYYRNGKMSSTIFSESANIPGKSRFDLSEVLPECHVVDMDILEKIDRELKRQKLTQVALASMAGLAKNKISKWKNGEGRPDVDETFRIARVLCVPVGWLADPNQSEFPIAPLPPLTEAEQAAVDLIRAHAYSKAEVLLLMSDPVRVADRIPLAKLNDPPDNGTGSPPVKPNRRKG